MSEWVIVALLFILGIVALLRGVFMLSTAAGWIVAGVVLLLVAMWPLVRRRVFGS